MRPVEILMTCLALAGAIFLLMGYPATQAAILTFIQLILLLLVIHIGVDGPRWQLTPLYVAAAALLLCALTLLAVMGVNAADLHWTHLVLRSAGALVLILTGGTLALCRLLPMFRLPTPTGPHAVGTRILYTVDSMRDAEGGSRPDCHRELMVQVWYPAQPKRGPRAVYRRREETTLKSSHHSLLRTHSLRDAPVLATDAPYPLLIFSPAWTGQRTQSTFLMQELASHGFVVASIDHTYYSGRVAFPDGRVLDGHMAPALGDFTYLSIQEGLELADQFLHILTDDVIFVVDAMTELNGTPDSGWYHCLDLSSIGALGHSIGGAAAAEACRRDGRILAALNLDGWSFGDVLRHGLSKPWMVIYGKGVEVEPPNPAEQPEGVRRYWQVNRENFAIVEEALRRHGGYCMTIAGASHWNFSDRPLYSPLRSHTGGGDIDAARGHRIIADAALAFFTESLHRRDGLLVADAMRRYPEVALLVQPDDSGKPVVGSRVVR